MKNNYIYAACYEDITNSENLANDTTTLHVKGFYTTRAKAMKRNKEIMKYPATDSELRGTNSDSRLDKIYYTQKFFTIKIPLVSSSKKPSKHIYLADYGFGKYKAFDDKNEVKKFLAIKSLQHLNSFGTKTLKSWGIKNGKPTLKDLIWTGSTYKIFAPNNVDETEYTNGYIFTQQVLHQALIDNDMFDGSVYKLDIRPNKHMHQLRMPYTSKNHFLVRDNAKNLEIRISEKGNYYRFEATKRTNTKSDAYLAHAMFSDIGSFTPNELVLGEAEMHTGNPNQDDMMAFGGIKFNFKKFHKDFDTEVSTVIKDFLKAKLSHKITYVPYHKYLSFGGFEEIELINSLVYYGDTHKSEQANRMANLGTKINQNFQDDSGFSANQLSKAQLKLAKKAINYVKNHYDTYMKTIAEDPKSAKLCTENSFNTVLNKLATV